MDWVQAHWSACFWCLCTVLAVVRASCPENALEKAMKCTSGQGLGPPSSRHHHNAFVERGQIERAKRACRDNSFQAAITCLEDLTQQCQGSSDQEHFLRNMVDAKKAREYVTYFCSHLNDYQQYAPCIGRMHRTLTQCVHQQRRTMQTKVKASSNMDYLMTSTCKYFNAAEVCSERVLSKDCSSEAADMVAGVFVAFRPPVCHSASRRTSQDAHSDTSAGNGAPGSRSSWSRSRSSPWWMAEVTCRLCCLAAALAAVNLFLIFG
ncbi:uncharacterized protein LOC143284814 [Babylonia areolata]|uniref:uncharacterized protein LOC143284814 n=1 Tax=Babylonia areolata TaxID=304850 RepID=UPI003FD4DA40